MRRVLVAIVPLFMALGAAADTFTVTNVNDSGAGSLRQAILDANLAVGNDTIAFNIPGSGVHTIALLSDLPVIDEPVRIDGYTQPGSSANTLPVGQGLDTVLTIEIDGTGTNGTCLTVNAPNSGVLAMIIRGLVINRCPLLSIRIFDGGDGALISGNFLGTDPTGEQRRPGVQEAGVGIDGATGVFIGGTTPSVRNLISGFDDFGISVAGDLTVIRGNLIGTNAAGTAAILGSAGVSVSGVSSSTTIGGLAIEERNLVSGHIGVGIHISGSNTLRGNLIGTDITGTLPLGNETGVLVPSGAPLIVDNVIGAGKLGLELRASTSAIVEGNFIGTDETETADLGNSLVGILVRGGGTVGGLSPGQGNVIANNGGRGDSFAGGIVVAGSSANNVQIRGNRMFGNVPLGIDIAETAEGEVTPNDSGDPDTGPNGLQNFPLITSAVPGAASTQIEGLLNSTPSTAFDVDLYAAACPSFPKDYLEGETYLGSLQVSTDGSGNATFAVDVPVVLPVGQQVTATATDPAGNTSEFSQRIVFSTDPPSGPPGGGVASTLTGMLFEAGATVTVGGVPATDVNVLSPEAIAATMPARPAGTTNDVAVSNPSGLAGILRNGWVVDFNDVAPSHPFHDFVVTLVANGISGGIGGGLYGVGNTTLRQQMAVFLLKGKHGVCYVPHPCTGVFPDVPCPSQFADWIEALFAEGITGGCGGGNYCPQSPVRRDQMAVFLLKARHGSTFVPLPCAGAFDDVTCPSLFADWIERLAFEGITTGCGGGNYCPLNNNTRGQMAVFVVKTFNLQ